MFLLLSPTIATTLETSLNHVIFCDGSHLHDQVFRNQSMKPTYQRLKNKMLSLTLKELPSPLILLFSEQKIDIITSNEIETNCKISTNLSSLLKLKDRQQLGSLINQHKIIVDGDIQVLQNFVALVDTIEWDPTEYLAPYIGDIAAESIRLTGEKIIHSCQKIVAKQKNNLGLAIREEWQLAPGSLETAYFYDQIESLEVDINALNERIVKLESY